ncbi:MAG: adenosyl cobinamide kinase/adenosyl cobinamide phosphate [Actinobacteria bacterium]|nr:MAG: adenosyl cobinamide kinase/adenosyl cobinamide phosphate [Actinomycetota bacterium]MDO8950885.1 bifunctional adenosylcobinamide kinase/adenosylcobinamide-phosphate guanylyltransferase [Actinomycetota bacterium]
MALVVITGGARSGKSAVAARLACEKGSPIVVAVAGVGDGDDEMAARIERHRADRPDDWTTLEVAGIPVSDWLPRVPDGACLVVDCLGTVMSGLLYPSEGTVPTEAGAEILAHALVDALTARAGDTIIVTNEVGMGVVPVSESGRLFRDVLGRANARLVDVSDRAFLVVAGRCFDLSAMPRDAAWPTD